MSLLKHVLLFLVISYLSSALTLQVRTRSLPLHPHPHRHYIPKVATDEAVPLSSNYESEVSKGMPQAGAIRENKVFIKESSETQDIKRTNKRIIVSASLSVLTIVVLCYLFQVVAICSRRSKITLNENEYRAKLRLGSVPHISSRSFNQSPGSSDYFPEAVTSQ